LVNDTFGCEYESQRSLLQSASLAGDVGDIQELDKILGADGPDRASADALEKLRTVVLKVGEAESLMKAASLDPGGSGLPADDGVKKSALLKFLRNLYMVGARGSQQVWVLSTPAAYTKYPQDELLSAKSTHAAVKAKLADVSEKFDAETRKRFGEATQLGLAWVESAKVVLASAATDAKYMEKVKRWFATSATSAEDINKTIARVLAGFKKMAASLNYNQVVVTDLPQKRSDPNQQYTDASCTRSARCPKARGRSMSSRRCSTTSTFPSFTI
jgi:hypothetical protein